MNKKRIVLILLVTFLGVLWYWALVPEPQILQPFCREIDEMAADRKISLISVQELRSEFMKRSTFGGAGGMGAAKIIAANPVNFFQLLPKDTIIVVTTKRQTRQVVKTFWGVSRGMPLIIFWQTYKAPHFHYQVKEVTEETVIFGKNFRGTVLMAVLGTVLGTVLFDILGVVIPKR